MVAIRIIVEGGGTPGNMDIATASNRESFRESLHSFFSRLLQRDDVSISLGYSYRNATKQFLKENAAILFVDLDMPKVRIDDWFTKCETENPEKPIIIPIEKRQDVYFMVQEMEAWFLKQPECFEKWAQAEGYTRKNVTESISEHSLIKNQDIEEISKPSDKTDMIMHHFFEKRIAGEKRRIAHYGKLKTAPLLLDSLDVMKLLLCDTELQRFRNRFAPV